MTSRTCALTSAGTPQPGATAMAYSSCLTPSSSPTWASAMATVAAQSRTIAAALGVAIAGRREAAACLGLRATRHARACMRAIRGHSARASRRGSVDAIGSRSTPAATAALITCSAARRLAWASCSACSGLPYARLDLTAASPAAASAAIR